jgi:hypothetical protein
MSSESNINKLTFNQMSENKYSSLIPVEGEFYVTPDYINLPLLTSMWFDHIVNDISWLRSDTFAWQSGDVYTAVYNHLVSDISGKTASSETVGGVTISYYLADDGHKITTDETSVENIYTATGVAWYYILDTTNHRFKLPRTKFGFTGLRDNVGNYVAPGLPQPELVSRYDASATTTGGHHNEYDTDYGSDGSTVRHISSAYNNTGGTDEYVLNVNEYNKWAKTNVSGYKNVVDLDLRDNAIYGNSATVQPTATQMYLYFYVGNFTNSAIEQTAGINAELLNQCKAALEDYKIIKQPNYYSYRWEGLSSVSSAQVHEFTMTVKRGNPIFLQMSGDHNPVGGSAWISLRIYKNNVEVSRETAVSASESYNLPFCISYFDTDAKSVGEQITYKFTIRESGSGTTNLREDNIEESPKIIAFEL